MYCVVRYIRKVLRYVREKFSRELFDAALNDIRDIRRQFHFEAKVADGPRHVFLTVCGKIAMKHLRLKIKSLPGTSLHYDTGRAITKQSVGQHVVLCILVLKVNAAQLGTNDQYLCIGIVATKGISKF